MNIILLTKKDWIEKDIYKISDYRFVHIKNILKSEKGNKLEIGILNGSKGIAEIITIDKNCVTLKIIALKENKKLQPNFDLILALPRPQTLKKVLSTIASFEVSNLYLIRSAKVEKSYFQSPLLEKKNFTKYLIEGLSQGKHTQLPNVSIHKRFKQFIENYFMEENSNSVKLLAHTKEKIFLNQLKLNKEKNIVIAIGPEGGWNEFEVSLMIQNGFQEFRLSHSILRVENAVTAALAQLEMINQYRTF